MGEGAGAWHKAGAAISRPCFNKATVSYILGAVNSPVVPHFLTWGCQSPSCLTGRESKEEGRQRAGAVHPGLERSVQWDGLGGTHIYWAVHVQMGHASGHTHLGGKV